MKIVYEVHDAAELTIGDAETLRDCGLELEMVGNKVLALMNLGKLMDEEEDELVLQDMRTLRKQPGPRRDLQL